MVTRSHAKREKASKESSSTLVMIPEEELPSCCNSCCGHNCWWEPPSSQAARSCGNECLSMEFCRYSSIHGLKYIGNVRGHILERILWTIFFLVALIASVSLITNVLTKYFNSPVTVTFTEEAITIDDVPFPAITICNVNNVRLSMVDELIRNVTQGKNLGLTNAEIYEALVNLDFVGHVCDATSTSFSSKFDFFYSGNHLGELLQAFHSRHEGEFTKNATTRKRPDVTSFLQKFAQPCEEMIQLCMWQNKPANIPGEGCTKLFRSIITDFGQCCTFNMVPEILLTKYPRTTVRDDELVRKWRQRKFDTDSLILDDKETREVRKKLRPGSPPYPPEYPQRVRSSGISNGISIVVDPDMWQYFCTASDSFGFQIALHLPTEFPKIAEYGDAVRHNTEVFIKVRPEVTKADEGIRDLAQDIRNCYFTDEFTLKYFTTYTLQNCADECYANITYATCNCSQFYMPRDPERALCRHEGVTCSLDMDQFLVDTKDDFCGECRSTCNDISYIAEMTTRPLRHDLNIWHHPQYDVAHWINRNVSLIHVYFGEDSAYPKIRKRLFGTTELLAAVGSLLGLTIGFSAMSLFELVYFVAKKVVGWILRALRIGQLHGSCEFCFGCCEETDSQDDDGDGETRREESGLIRRKKSIGRRHQAQRQPTRTTRIHVGHVGHVQNQQNMAWGFYPRELAPRAGNNNYY